MTTSDMNNNKPILLPLDLRAWSTVLFMMLPLLFVTGLLVDIVNTPMVRFVGGVCFGLFLGVVHNVVWALLVRDKDEREARAKATIDRVVR